MSDKAGKMEVGTEMEKRAESLREAYMISGQPVVADTPDSKEGWTDREVLGYLRDEQASAAFWHGDQG